MSKCFTLALLQPVKIINGNESFDSHPTAPAPKIEVYEAESEGERTIDQEGSDIIPLKSFQGFNSQHQCKQ